MVTLKLDNLTLNVPDDLDVEIKERQVTITHKYPKYTLYPPNQVFGPGQTTGGTSTPQTTWQSGLGPQTSGYLQTAAAGLQNQTLGKCRDTNY